MIRRIEGINFTEKDETEITSIVIDDKEITNVVIRDWEDTRIYGDHW